MLRIFCRMLIEYVEDDHDTAGRWKGYVYAGSMLVAAIIQSIFLHQYFHTMFTIGMRLRSAIIGLVYEKVSREKKFSFSFQAALDSQDSSRYYKDLITVSLYTFYFQVCWGHNSCSKGLQDYRIPQYFGLVCFSLITFERARSCMRARGFVRVIHH